MNCRTIPRFLPTSPHFHVLGKDGFHHPIRFVFVSEKLRRNILQEREIIRAALPLSRAVRQEEIFARYDPGARSRAFQAILRRFGTSQSALRAGTTER